MLNLHFLMMPVRHRFSAFILKSIPSKLKNQCKNMRFDFFFKPIIPLFSPIRRLYPPACKPYGLEAEPKANIPLFQL